MKKKKLLMLALTVILIIFTFSVNAFGAPSVISGNYKYIVQDDDTVKIIAYLGKETKVNVPSEIDGKTVTALGFGLFSSSIETHTVVVPDSVVSMDGTLSMSGVKNVHLGAGVEKIRSGEFYSLRNITVSQNNPNFASVDGVLYDKEMKCLICVPTGKEYNEFRIPEGVEEIGDNAIVDVSMKSLIIPSTVKHIGRNAFSVNGITSLVIPSSVESLSMYAIYQCNGLRKIEFKNGNLKQIESHVIEECEKLTTIRIPANVESIGKFYSCPSLRSIIVDSENKDYTTIDGVLYNKDVTRLISYPVARANETYIVPDSVTVIGSGAFVNVRNRNLKKLYLHKGITGIEDEAFIYSGGFDVYYEGSKAELDALEIADLGNYLPEPVCNTYIYRPVTGLQASATDTTAKISWNKVPYATGYRVYVKTKTGQKPLKTTTSTSYTADGLLDSTDYTFIVKSYRKIDGVTVWAPEQTAVSVKTALGVTASLKSTPGTKQITLNWSAVKDATGYRVFILNEKTENWDVAVRTTGKKTTATIRNLEPGTKYTFAVRAYVNNGTIVWAPKLKSINTLTKPGVTDKLSESVGENSIALRWNKVPGATGYRVFVLRNGDWKALKTTTGLTYTATGLSQGTKYTFAVKAYTKFGGVTCWASSYKKLEAATIPGATKAVTASKISSEYVILNWDAVKGATGYRVYLWNTQTKQWDTVVRATTKQTATVKSLTPGKNYIFAVKAYIKAESGYVWAKKYTQLKVKTGALTDDYVRRMFIKANDLEEKWHIFNYVFEDEINGYADPRYSHVLDRNDYIDVYKPEFGFTFRFYAVIDDDIKSTEELRKEMLQYFTEEHTEDFIESSGFGYRDYNGKMYMHNGDGGGLFQPEAPYKDSLKKISSTEYLYRLYSSKENMYINYKVVYEKGRWVFGDEYGLFFPIWYPEKNIYD